MSVRGVHNGLPVISAASGRRVRYFDRGGTFDRVGNYARLYARTMGRNLTGHTAPGAAIRLLGGPSSNLYLAFASRAAGDTTDATTVDVLI